jgi:proteasome lid subunit RPN8/RPN11
MVITDMVYAEIRDRIAAHPPERGGALYGPRHYPFVTHFEFDPDGLTSDVSYVPSTRLIENVPRVERETGLQFKGIVHSHPRGLTRPSGGDEQTVGSFFRLNPHIAQMALPIVQQLPPLQPGEHLDQRVFLHWYRAERAGPAQAAALPAAPSVRAYAGLGRFGAPVAQPSAAPTVRVLVEDLHVLPLRTHVERVLEHLAAQGVRLALDPALQPLKVHNAELVGLVARETVAAPMGGGPAAAPRELYFFVSIDYPIVPPVVLRESGGSTTQLRFCWDGLGDLEPGLAALAQAFSRLH